MKKPIAIASAALLTVLYCGFLVFHQSVGQPSLPIGSSATQPYSHEALTQESAFQMRKQATDLLSNGKRAEGLALLNELTPFLKDSDPEFQAWVGAALVMQALDAKSGLTKMSAVDNGMATLDNALQAAPNNQNCRIIRAQTAISLPEFFPTQRSIGVHDLAQVVDWYLQDFPALITDSKLNQTPQAIDPIYLTKTISWALSQNGFPDQDITLLKNLLEKVQTKQSLSQKILASKESQK